LLQTGDSVVGESGKYIGLWTLQLSRFGHLKLVMQTGAKTRMVLVVVVVVVVVVDIVLQLFPRSFASNITALLQP